MAETACIVYGPEAGKFAYDQLITYRQQLGDILLRQEGIELALALALPADDDQEQQFALVRKPAFTDGNHVDMEDAKQRLTRVAADELGDVVLDRWSKNWGYGIPGRSGPTANEPLVQQYGASKLLMARHVLDPLNMGMPTFALTTALAHRPAELTNVPLVTKPDDGGLGIGLKTHATMDALTEWLKDQSLSDKQLASLIVQPKYDFSGKLPGLRPYSRRWEDQGLLELQNARNTDKEVRVYVFHNDSGEADCYGVPRYLERGTGAVDRDDFFPVDPESLSHLYEPARAIVGRLAACTGARAVYAAVDMGYGVDPHTNERSYKAIEVNCRFPHPIDRDTHMATSQNIRSLLARHIAQLV